jgi:hypothetical protein
LSHLTFLVLVLGHLRSSQLLLASKRHMRARQTEKWADQIVLTPKRFVSAQNTRGRAERWRNVATNLMFDQ